MKNIFLSCNIFMYIKQLFSTLALQSLSNIRLIFTYLKQTTILPALASLITLRQLPCRYIIKKFVKTVSHHKHRIHQILLIHILKLLLSNRESSLLSLRSIWHCRRGKYFYLFPLLSSLLCSSFIGCTEQISPQDAIFSYFLYKGNDSIFNTPIDSEKQYFNPILSGFHPDPSICRKGNDYYLVNSSFAYYPGIPIYHSTDLVNWTSIGHVLNRPSQLNLDNIRLSGGIYAPDIKYNPYNDTFYLITTCVDGIGNFLVKTKDPMTKEWSEPILLPDVGGIDPAIFFDENGKSYIVNNDAPAGKAEYDGHRAIWIREFDTATDQTMGKARVIIDGGVDKTQHPIWIEGPHLYKINDKYYLMAAEGGTGPEHSEVIFSSHSPEGPFKPCTINPILTQRDLPAERKSPITCAGHADLVETPEGKWYAVFLGCRPYKNDYYNTGRETFLLPVSWQKKQPIILKKGEEIPYIVEKQVLKPISNTLTGNFTDSTASFSLPLENKWTFIRTPRKQWWRIKNGKMIISPEDTSIRNVTNPAFIGRRIQHQCFEAETKVSFCPASEQDFAGLVCFQNEKHYFAFGITGSQNNLILSLRYAQGEDEQILSELPLESPTISVKVIAEQDKYSFYYLSKKTNDWIEFYTEADGRILSTHTAGGFTGAMVGMYASGRHNVPRN